MNAIIVAVGIVVLMFIAVGVGMSMDTAGQRREADRVARERRLLAQQRTASRSTDRCRDCPFRFPDQPV
jgi:hypothetical protein